MVRICHLHCHGQVQSLVRELRSLQATWSSQKANKQKRSNNFLKRPPVSWLRYQLSPSWPSGHVAVTAACCVLTSPSTALPLLASTALFCSAPRLQGLPLPLHLVRSPPFPASPVILNYEEDSWESQPYENQLWESIHHLSPPHSVLSICSEVASESEHTWAGSGALEILDIYLKPVWPQQL